MKEPRNPYNGTIDENGKTYFGPPPQMEEIREENKRMKELIGDEFEEYYQNHIKGTSEVYGSDGVYLVDKVNKSTAWEIWKAAWKAFERRKE